MNREGPVGQYGRKLWDARAELRLTSGDAMRLGRELGRAIYQEQEADAGYLAETDHRVRWCREVLQRVIKKQRDLRCEDAALEAVAAMLLGRQETAVAVERVKD